MAFNDLDLVEFANDKGETLAMVTATPDQIAPQNSLNSFSNPLMNEDAIVVIEEVSASLIDSANEITGSSSFDEGRRIGYYEALSSIVSQCEAMGVDLEKVGLKGFLPESILAKAKNAA